ncbi:bacitracin ABC transporter ATP-binding protein [Cytobacillus oceanisediminis]|uniref:Bacitracin ABC transporter ATP-binding protein n=1 Tax=Niallia alba TaxID=2729105 RepID=A0A7Y0K6B1_9BACI|nr:MULTISPECIES: hypothetical protein [Bacillaceae]EOR25242.1 hypothetical protein A499_05775 [Niallia nealsonii AAU1]MBQ6446515.1 bacitracin ABC transporter ATP-binding protein [Bacillus sp. (in: firmicutes)]MDU1847186.1 bacitracin ABC transporter ATP-binding protein [Niallia nealsonii]MBZ9535278.1 bacitracin ABC transporter ATP-binding protein [Cytobacillus oceanisediminis]MED3794565.1 bacitracin ABC transporter ATP-binding protein [Niallia alba]
MKKENKPIISDEFLDKLAEEINQLYGEPAEEESEDYKNNG